MMVAERAADLIRGDRPLPPQQVPFYRHRAPAGAAVGRAPSAPSAPSAPGSTSPR